MPRLSMLTHRAWKLLKRRTGYAKSNLDRRDGGA